MANIYFIPKAPTKKIVIFTGYDLTGCWPHYGSRHLRSDDANTINSNSKPNTIAGYIHSLL